MPDPANYQILSMAVSTWIVVFVGSLALFVLSFLFFRWNRCSSFVRHHLTKNGPYDYKEIFRDYLFHINSIEDKRSLYHAILKVVCDIVSSSDASLLLKDNGDYTVKESLGSKPASFQVGDINDFLRWLKEYKHTISRHELVNDKDFSRIKGDGLQYCVQFHAEACVPLFTGGKLLGVINIGSRAKGELFDKQTKELLDILAGQSAVALHNASLYEDAVRRNIQLQEVGRLKSQLLSNVSHEFRTPLNSIIGLADLMAEGGDGAITTEQMSHLQMISLSSKRLLETVSSMVDLAKLEANHLSLNVRRVNVPKLVSKIADNVKMNKETTLKLVLAKETPSIYGDEGWLEKLFSHVISNAVKYTPNGEIVVDAERSGEMLKVGIHDTGIGIAPEKQGMIFESFSQADGGVDRKYEGAGIGLAISKKVVELHGGRIWLHSAPGRGSHFYFTLPLKPIKLRAVELKN